MTSSRILWGAGCGTIVATAGLAYCRRSWQRHASNSEVPCTDAAACEPSTSGIGPSFSAAADFLDLRCDKWVLQSSTISPKYLVDLEHFSEGTRQKFGLSIFRMEEKYLGTVVPMRIVAYFPDISVDAVTKSIVDKRTRLMWDKNYAFFAVLNESDPHIGRLAEGCRNVLASSLRSLLGPRKPNAAVVDWSWACHRVANPSLERLGVKGRMFQYERLCWSEGDRNSPRGERTDVIAYRSVRNFSDAYPRASQKEDAAYSAVQDAVEMFFQRCRQSGDETVFMHHQSVAVIPVWGMPSLTWLLSSAARCPSVTHNAFSDMLSTNATVMDTSSRVSGTLMIVTSLNETPIPAGLPRFVENSIARYFTSQAYDMLYHHLLTAT